MRLEYEFRHKLSRLYSWVRNSWHLVNKSFNLTYKPFTHLNP